MAGISNERIVITGAGGFIGGSLFRRLASSDARVCGLVRDKRALDRLQPSNAGTGNAETAIGDIRNKQGLKEVFDGSKLVFHSAALVNGPESYGDYFETNVEGTRAVCEAALEVGVSRLVFISTCDVFGLPGLGTLFSEDSPYSEWGEKYADSKIAATRLVDDMKTRGLETTVVYPGWVYGPGDLQFVPSIIAQLRSGFLPLWARSEAKLNLVHINDLVDGLMLAGESQAARNEDFLLLDSNGIPFAEFCGEIAAALDVTFRTIRIPYGLAHAIARLSEVLAGWGLMADPLITTAIVKSFGHDFVFDASKAETLLGWKPRIDFAEGIRDALAWEGQRTGSFSA